MLLRDINASLLNENPELTPAELASTPTVLSQAGAFTVELDNNEQITIRDNHRTALVRMPYVIWKQLCRS